MEEFSKIVLTSSLTILGGVFVYVSGQIITRFFIDPYHEYTKILCEIADALIYYADLYMNPGGGSVDETRGPRIDEARKILRQKASSLCVRTHAIPAYGVFANCKLVPQRVDIQQAFAALISLSNSIWHGDSQENARLRDQIITALDLPRWSTN